MLNCYLTPIHKKKKTGKVKQNQGKVGYHAAQRAKEGMMPKNMMTKMWPNVLAKNHINFLPSLIIQIYDLIISPCR